MSAAFQVFISTFVDDRSTVFSSTNGIDARESLQYVNDHCLKDKRPGKFGQSFQFNDKWCCAVVFREIGETIVRGERRKFNEIRLAISDQSLHGTPPAEISGELIRKLESIRPTEFSNLQPIFVQVDPSNEKKQESPVKNMSDTKPFLLGLICVLVVGMFTSFLFSSFKQGSVKEKKTLLPPHETKEPVYYTDIIKFLEGRDVKITELLRPETEMLKERLRKKDIEFKDDNRRFEFIVIYFFWRQVAEYLVDTKLSGDNIERSIEFLCDPNEPAEKIFNELKENLAKTTQTIDSLRITAVKKINKFPISPGLTMKVEMDNRNWEDLPLALFFPVSGEGNNEVEGYLPGHYKNGCETWEKLYKAWGFVDGKELKESRDECIKQFISNIAQDLLAEGEKK